MPGYFTYPFEDDEATGYFGGYRRPQPASLDPNVVQVSDATPASPNATTDTLAYPNGQQVVDPFGHPYPRPPRPRYAEEPLSRRRHQRVR